MKKHCLRQPIVLFANLFTLFAIAVLSGATSGCGSKVSVSAGETLKIHTEEVAYIGDLSGTLSDEIERIFVNLVPYNESSSMPIFIAGETLRGLDRGQRDGLLNTFDNLKPIVLVHCDEAEINLLLGILGLEQNYALPEGLSGDNRYMELFAVDREADGHVFVWSMCPPGDGATPSDDVDAPAASGTRYRQR